VQLSNGQTLKAKVAGTGAPDKYARVILGQVAMSAGTYRLTVRPEGSLTRPLMNLRSVQLVPAAPAPAEPAFRNAPQKVKQGKDGAIQLSATTVQVHGPGVVFESKYGNLGCWYQPDAFGRWTFDVRQGGTFDVQLDWACQDSSAGNPFQVVLDDKVVLEAKVPGTGNWDTYRQQTFGQIPLDPGSHHLVFRSGGPIKAALIDLRTLTLAPADEKGKKP